LSVAGFLEYQRFDFEYQVFCFTCVNNIKYKTPCSHVAASNVHIGEKNHLAKALQTGTTTRAKKQTDANNKGAKKHLINQVLIRLLSYF
jgi:hypothetical protein